MDQPSLGIKSAPSLPLAVHVGFAGARDLVPDGLELDAQARPAFEDKVFEELRGILRDLPSELKLTAQHFVVTVSQMAAGADLMFSRVARELGWPQRVLLPQSRDAFLAASGSAGEDFTPAQREETERTLASAQVIEEVVVSSAPTRGERFSETSLHIAGESDLLVLLTVARRASRAGGAKSLISPALLRGVPVLELVLDVTAAGEPKLDRTWHRPTSASGETVPFLPPTLPAGLQGERPALALAGDRLPEPLSYIAALKALASERAGRQRLGFGRSARIIVGTHVLATLLAAAVVTKSSGDLEWLPSGLVKAALMAELVLLFIGFGVHQLLHHRRHTEEWALARLCAEICRSVLAYGNLPGRLTFLRHLPVPDSLTPLLRTLNVVHLVAVRNAPADSWRQALENYVRQRLDTDDGGQIPYYRQKQASAKTWATVAASFFAVMSLAAFFATLAKLGMKLERLDNVPWRAIAAGVFGIWSPVAAVGALSLAAAHDVEGRRHVFSDQFKFLVAQRVRLMRASAALEAASLAAETESRLLAETATWYARRAFTSVA